LLSTAVVFLKAPLAIVQRVTGVSGARNGAGPMNKQTAGDGDSTGGVKPWICWVSWDGMLHGLGKGRERGRPTAVPASRARVGLCEAQKGIGGAVGMYRSRAWA
jgi:hypothetical protein